MSFPSIDLFLKRLEDSKLLTAEQIASTRAKTETFDAKFAAELTAKHLIRNSTLTHWQAQILLSKGGTFFLGNHKLLELIGRGGMGTVYKAEHTVLGRIVAIKVMSRELMANKNLVARFHQEIQAGATLDNPHVVRSIDASVIGKTHFLVMEYIEGHDLWSILSKRKKLPPSEACEYIRQAAVGLQHAHEVGMVHRDIKPSNLIRTWTKHDLPLVKIFDMGLARIVSEQTSNDEMTRTGQIMGTPEYMSPEQGWDTKKVDIRGDIYSLGCTLFRLLTGRVPFQGENPLQTLMVRCTQDAPPLRKSAPELSAELETVLGKMLAKEPSRRFQTPGEVAEALAAFAVAPTRAEIELLEHSTDDSPPPELSDEDISHEEVGFEDFIHDLKEPEEQPELTVPVAQPVPVANVIEPTMPIQSTPTTKRRKAKPNTAIIASVATVGVLLVGALVWAISGNADHATENQPDSTSESGIEFEPLPENSIDEHTMLALQLRPVERSGAGTIKYRFTLGPTAPDGMSVDPSTGVLMWTPQESHGPARYRFDVQCVDVANPQRMGTARVDIRVNEVDQPMVVQPVPPTEAKVGETVVLDIKASDSDIPAQPIRFDLAPGSPPGARIDPQTGRFQWTIPPGMPPGQHTIVVLVDQHTLKPPVSVMSDISIIVKGPTQPTGSFVADIADRKIEQGKVLIVPIEFSRPISGVKVSIQTEFGNAKTAVIDEKTARIVWSPTLADEPGDYPFKIRFMIDNNPSLVDEKSFTVKVTSATATPPKKVVPKSPVAEVDKRLPIPAEADRKSAEKTIREVMPRQFAQAKANIKARAKLAGELLEKGDSGNGNRSEAMRYVLYELAQAEGVKSRDVRTALAAVRRLARIYQVDLVKQTLAVHDSFKLSGTSAADRDAVAESGVNAAFVATKSDRFEEATRALKWPESIARTTRDVELRKELLAATESLKTLQTEMSASPDQPPSDKAKLVKDQLTEVFTRLDFVPVFKHKDRVSYLDHSEKQLPDGGKAFWTIENGNLNLTAPSQDKITGIVDGRTVGERYTLRTRISSDTATGKLLLGFPSGGAFRGIEVSLRQNGFLSLRHVGTNNTQAPRTTPKRNGDWDDLEIHVNGKNLRVRLNGEVVNHLSNTPATLSGRLGIDAFLAGSLQLTILRLSDMRVRPW